MFFSRFRPNVLIDVLCVPNFFVDFVLLKTVLGFCLENNFEQGCFGKCFVCYAMISFFFETMICFCFGRCSQVRLFRFTVLSGTLRYGGSWYCLNKPFKFAFSYLHCRTGRIVAFLVLIAPPPSPQPPPLPLPMDWREGEGEMVRKV